MMDRQYLKTPFYGSREMKACLLQQGYLVSGKNGTATSLVAAVP